MTINKIEVINIDNIFLDEENPRLPTVVEKSQSEMIAYIARNTSITELMTAISENGYFPGEPIVVVPRDDNTYWAIEGNRRLTALKLLRDPSLFPKNKKVAEISEAAKYQENSVPCVVFEDRSEVLNYLGYRHITGVKQWDSLAKARYISMFFDGQTDRNGDPIVRYKEVARAIGSRYPFIKRQLDAFAVYNLAEKNSFYGIQKLDEETISFSLLSTALGYDSVLEYVSRSSDPYINPELLIEENVENLIKWLFEPNKDGETILGDSRNIQRLAIVASDEEALKVLATEHNFPKAFAMTKGVGVEFSDLLSEISQRISEAVASVALVDIEEHHLNVIGEIYKQARALKRIAEDSND